MYTFILVLLLIDSLVPVAAVLLQAPKGGGLSATFGGAGSSSDSFIGTRQAANLLTKASWWCGGLFIALAFVLQLVGQPGAGAPKSVLDQPFSQQPAAPASTPSGAVPAVPLSPVTPAQQAPANTKPAPAPATPPKK